MEGSGGMVVNQLRGERLVCLELRNVMPF